MSVTYPDNLPCALKGGPNFIYEVLGRSGWTYEVPYEVWLQIDAPNKRMLERDNPSQIVSG